MMGGVNVRSLSVAIGGPLDSLSESLIGWTFPPPNTAIADSGWTPDDPLAATYCLRCGDSVGAGEATPAGCATCREGAELSGGIADGVVRLGPYVDTLRRWVLAVKYKHWDEMGTALGRLLGQQLLRSKLIDPARTVIVPLPMPWQRRWFRGIDHAAVIAEGVSHEVRSPIARVLARKNGPSQTSLTPSERKRTGGRLLRIRRHWGGWRMEDLHIVLVDDVRTTGATLRTASRLVKSLKPAKVVCVVVGVSDSRARKQRANSLRSAALLKVAPASTADHDAAVVTSAALGA
jgi:ComF family protein